MLMLVWFELYANDQHAQTPTPSAGAADPPHRGEGMLASDLNYLRETPANPLPLVGRGAGWGSTRISR